MKVLKELDFSDINRQHIPTFFQNGCYLYISLFIYRTHHTERVGLIIEDIVYINNNLKNLPQDYMNKITFVLMEAGYNIKNASESPFKHMLC